MDKIIIVADWLINYITKEPYMFCKKLESDYGWNIVKLSMLHLEKIKEIRKRKCIILCVTYDSFDITVLKCENTIMIYKIDDLYPFKDIRKKCIDNADLLISPYEYLLKEKPVRMLYPLNNKESFHIPYSAVSKFYKDITLNNNPKEKILVSGSITPVYKLRKYILNLTDYIDILEHPGYKNLKHKIIDEKYYKKLSEYLCCFTDASNYKYILLKVFEICSVGTLLLCDDLIEKELYKMGFKNNVNYISCNKENLKSKMEWILNKGNRIKVDEIRLNGMNLVRSYHSTSHRAKLFNIIIDNKYYKKTHIARFNNDLYFTPDKIQVDYINSGRAEPYSGNIDIVNEYIRKRKSNRTYLDIGVNIATHSIVYSKIFEKVISFEPDNYNYTQSKENLLINNVTNVNLLHRALGSKSGYVTTEKHSNHSNGCIFTKLTKDKTNIVQVKLDSLELENIDYMKIDVEGHELDVLKGSIETIKKNKPIIEFEYNNLGYTLFNVKIDDIEKFLNNLNYKKDKQFGPNYYFIYDSKSIIT